jgi:hypothetical protein
VISSPTKSGNGAPKVTLSTEGGSFGTTNERASLSGSRADFNYVFNVQHFQSASTPGTMGQIARRSSECNRSDDRRLTSLLQAKDSAWTPAEAVDAAFAPAEDISNQLAMMLSICDEKLSQERT